MDEFDLFWAAYPRRISKGEARKAWKQTASIRPPLAEILVALEVAKKHWTDPKYTPHASSWLRAERWSDEWPTITAQDATGSAEAWSTLRQCLRSNKEPPAAISAAARAIGGFNRLMELDSAVINKLQGQFESAYKLGAH